MMAGYLCERLLCVMYTSHLAYTALNNPNYFYHLTYWSLGLQAAYFTIDKASPRATTAVYIFHGAALIGALAVVLGYTAMAFGGVYRFGSFVDWENAIGRHSGTITWPRNPANLYMQKFYEHYLPPLALLVDTHLNREHLVRIYENARLIRTAALGIAGYLVVVQIFERFSKSIGKGSGIQVYQQPHEFETAYILGKLGMSADGLDDDLIYIGVLKVIALGGAAIAYMPIISPLAKGGRKEKSA